MLVAFRSLAASCGDQLGFAATIQLAAVPRSWIFVECSFQTTFDKTIANALHTGTTNIDRSYDLWITQTFTSFEQDHRSFELAHFDRPFACHLDQGLLLFVI